MANLNHNDFSIAIARVLAPGGSLDQVRDDEEEDEDEPQEKMPQDEDWAYSQQYDGDFQVLSMLLMNMQRAKVLSYEELMWAKCMLEYLSAPFSPCTRKYR